MHVNTSMSGGIYMSLPVKDKASQYYRGPGEQHVVRPVRRLIFNQACPVLSKLRCTMHHLLIASTQTHDSFWTLEKTMLICKVTNNQKILCWHFDINLKSGVANCRLANCESYQPVEFRGNSTTATQMLIAGCHSLNVMGK